MPSDSTTQTPTSWSKGPQWAGNTCQSRRGLGAGRLPGPLGWALQGSRCSTIYPVPVPRRYPNPNDSETVPFHLRQRGWGRARPHTTPSGRGPASSAERSARAARLGADTCRGCFCRVLLRWLLTAAGQQAPARRVRGLWAERDSGEPRRRRLGDGGGSSQPGLLCPPQRLGGVGSARAGAGRATVLLACVGRVPVAAPCGDQRGGTQRPERPQTSALGPCHVPDGTLRFSGELDSGLKPHSKANQY